MIHPAVSLLELAARDFDWSSIRPVFFGGAVVPLYLDRPGRLAAARDTEDVDLVLDVAIADLEDLERQLSARGFAHDLADPHAPRCRRVRNGLKYDIQTPSDLPAQDWMRPENRVVRRHLLPSGAAIEAASLWTLLALKAAAFEDRGRNDWLASEDLEDIVTLIDGCTLFEAASSDEERPRSAFAHWARALHSDVDLVLRLRPHLAGDHAEERAVDVVQRLGSLAD